MTLNLWFFLSATAVAGAIFALSVLYLSHKRQMRILEIEALTGKGDSGTKTT